MKSQSSAQLCHPAVSPPDGGEEDWLVATEWVLAETRNRIHPSPQIHPHFNDEDSPWVHEYKLGAECDFHNIAIPDGLSGYAFQDIAVYMYDFGAVLVAFRMGKRQLQDWRREI